MNVHLNKEDFRVKKIKHKKIKVSLKEENRILKDMCKYLFGISQTSGEMFLYFSKRIETLEKKLK